MAQQLISIGFAPDDGQGTPLRNAGTIINNNFTELYSGLLPSQAGNAGAVLGTNGTSLFWSSASTGTVTSVGATGANGVSVVGPAITSAGSFTIGLGAITPASVAATGTVTGSNISGTTSGTNTGDQTPDSLLPPQAAAAGQFLTTNGTTVSWANVTGASGGTVTSIGVIGANGVTSTGGPVTSSGVITLGLANVAPTGNITLADSSFLTGNFTDFASRPVIQSNVTDGATFIDIVPNGISGRSAIFFNDSSNRANNAAFFVGNGPSGVAHDIVGITRGTGVAKPIVFGVNNTIVALTIGVNGNIDAGYDLTVAGDIAAANLSGTNTGDQTLNSLLPVQTAAAGLFLTSDGTNTSWATVSAGSGGTVTSINITGLNGVTSTSGPVTSSGLITVGLGDITPTSVAATGTVTGLNLSGTSSGTNTGDQTITLTGDVTGSGTGSFVSTLADTAVTAGSYTNGNFTVDSKGRITAASSMVSGTATLVAGTATVAATSVTAGSIIMLTVQSLGTVTVPQATWTSTKTAGTGFDITSADITDTSTVGWFIIN